MTYRTLAATACAVAALAVAGQALAQAAPRAAAPAAAAPVAAAPITHGPVPAGVCVFDFQRLVDTSLAGKAVATRLKTISDTAAAEVNTEGKAIDTDAKALMALKPTLDQSTFESRAAALQVRDNALGRKAQQRQAELQKTEQDALVKLSQATDPSLRTVYMQRNCGMLMNRTSLLFWNPSADITDAVVANLNGRVTTITFERARLDPPAGGAQAPGGQ